jgi:hypothetical protein
VIEVPLFKFFGVNTFTVTTSVSRAHAFPSVLYIASVRSFDLACGSQTVKKFVNTRRKTINPSFRKIKTTANKSSLKLAALGGKRNIAVVVGNRM